jgi:hypothetical protein
MSNSLPSRLESAGREQPRIGNMEEVADAGRMSSIAEKESSSRGRDFKKLT